MKINEDIFKNLDFGDTIIEIKSLAKSFGDKKVLKDIDLKINKGEIFGLAGHSGSGKTTLLRTINMLINHDDGELRLFDQDVSKLQKEEKRVFQKNIGMIFQNFSLISQMNVYDNIALPLRIWNYKESYIDKKVKELLDLVNLMPEIYNYPTSLSGGQKQRVAIARALSTDPKILLSDESTSALDPETTNAILDLIKDLKNKLNLTVIITTHEMDVIKKMCSSLAFLEDGKIMDVGKTEKLFLYPSDNFLDFMDEKFIDDLYMDIGVNMRVILYKDEINIPLTKLFGSDNFKLLYSKTDMFDDKLIKLVLINIEDKESKNLQKNLEDKSIEFSKVKRDK